MVQYRINRLGNGIVLFTALGYWLVFKINFKLIRLLCHRTYVLQMVITIGIDDGAFWSQMQASVDVRIDVLGGLLKSVVFGIAVGLISVFEGYFAAPTAEGIASATTRTVVTSSLAVLLLDLVLTVMMFRGLS